MNADELRAAILAKSSPKPELVSIPGHGSFYVRVMTAFDADMNRKTLENFDKREDGCNTGRTLALILTDETGAALFDIGDADAMLRLSKLPADLQSALLNAANRVNGVGQGNA